MDEQDMKDRGMTQEEIREAMAAAKHFKDEGRKDEKAKALEVMEGVEQTLYEKYGSISDCVETIRDAIKAYREGK